MGRKEILKTKVEALYKSNYPNQADWANSLWEEHVDLVSRLAEEIARSKGADVDYCVAGALLHDIADTKMKRDDPRHEDESALISEDLLSQSGFDEKETKIILEEIIAPHGCKDKLPTLLEGKVMATADALAHLTTSFYIFFPYVYGFGKERDYNEYKNWVLSKIDRDFYKKIHFEEYRDQARIDYEALKRVFER